MKKCWLFNLLALLLFSCAEQGQQAQEESEVVGVRYAKGFSIDEQNGFKVLKMSVQDQQELTYVLVPKGQPHPKLKDDEQIIEVPLERVATLSSTDISFLKSLGLSPNLVAIGKAQYVRDTLIQQRFEKGELVELGSPMDPNIEQLVATNPQAVFIDPSGYQYLHQRTSVPAILVASYLEAHPLGRAEWMRFFGALMGQSDRADSLFQTIEQEYLSLKTLADTVQNKPTVFAGVDYSGTWYIPNGESYVAHFFEDAGAEYVWNELSGNGTTPMEFEAVYEKALTTDFWRVLHMGALTTESLETQNALYKDFKAVKEKQVIYCDTELTDFYGQGVVEPQVVLADLIKCFHPEVLPKHEPAYYRLVK